MIAFFSSWAQNIIIAVVIATIIELILPSGTSKKYVKVVIGIYIMFSIISPAIEKFAGNKININEVFDAEKYEKEIDNSGKELSKKIEENNNKSIKDIYESNIKTDIVSKLKKKGYIVTNTYIKIQNSENYEIEQISLTVKKDELTENSEEKNNEIKINSVNKIEINNYEKIKDNAKNKISENDVNIIKDFLNETYSLEKEKIEILS